MGRDNGGDFQRRGRRIRGKEGGGEGSEKKEEREREGRAQGAKEEGELRREVGRGDGGFQVGGRKEGKVGRG